MHKLRVWNPVLFSDSEINAAARAVRGPDESTHHSIRQINPLLALRSIVPGGSKG